MSKLPINRIIFSTALIVSAISAQNIDEAIKLFNAFQFDKAKAIFEALVKEENNPRIAEVFYYLARLTTNPDSSIQYYRTIVNKYPHSRYAEVAHLEIAKIFIGRQDFKNALVTLNQLSKDYPNSEIKDEALFWTGVVFIEMGNKESGYKTLQELISAYPKSIWTNRAKNLIPPTIPQKEYYTVQVGSFRNKENAEKKLVELKMKGFDARIVEAVVMDKIYYRVWIGEFETMEQANSLAAKIDSLGIKGNVVKGY